VEFDMIFNRRCNTCHGEIIKAIEKMKENYDLFLKDIKYTGLYENHPNWKLAWDTKSSLDGLGVSCLDCKYCIIGSTFCTHEEHRAEPEEIHMDRVGCLLFDMVNESDMWSLI
jgi:hypothetical protein